MIFMIIAGGVIYYLQLAAGNEGSGHEQHSDKNDIQHKTCENKLFAAVGIFCMECRSFKVVQLCSIHRITY